MYGWWRYGMVLNCLMNQKINGQPVVKADRRVCGAAPGDFFIRRHEPKLIQRKGP